MSHCSKQIYINEFNVTVVVLLLKVFDVAVFTVLFDVNECQ